MFFQKDRFCSIFYFITVRPNDLRQTATSRSDRLKNFGATKKYHAEGQINVDFHHHGDDLSNGNTRYRVTLQADEVRRLCIALHPRIAAYCPVNVLD